jgi:hypothetical protein
MGFLLKDDMERLIEEMTEVMNALSATISGGKPHDALAPLASAHARVLGPMGSSIGRLDAGSVVALLGPEKTRLHVKLLRLEAEARDALGEAAPARAIGARADGLERALPEG